MIRELDQPDGNSYIRIVDRFCVVAGYASSMTLAVGVLEVGGEVTMVEREVRAPGPGEVRLRVHAAAVNPTDLQYRDGVEGIDPPWTPGMDAAGTIESVGPGVERLSVGEAVMAAVLPRRPEGGAQAALVVVPAASVVPIPAGATFAQAATLPMNGLTAKVGLSLLPSSGSLFVTGGAGLLVSYVIPLARAAGLRVFADAKPEDADLVRSFGAEVVERGSLPPEPVDGVFDTALLHERTFPALRDGGVLAVVRGWSPPSTPRGIEVRPVRVATALERTDWLEELRASAEAGELQLRVAAEFAPERAAEAQERMAAGGLRGRIVLVFA
jgi:NADPH:quinone reductase-like Zn-dependent oxidoreductase